MTQDYFDNSHVLNIGEQGSLGPQVSPWQMVVQNFRQQWYVDSAMALDYELGNRWRESLDALRAAGHNFGDPTIPRSFRTFAEYFRNGTEPRPTIGDEVGSILDPLREGAGLPSRRTAYDEFKEMIRANDTIRQLNNPRIKTFEQILQEVSEMQQGIEEETASMSERASGFGNVVGFAGTMAGSFTIRDPINIATAPVGWGRTVAARVASDMAVAGATTAFTEYADVMPNRALAGLPERDPLIDILASTVGAGLIRGGIEGVGAGYRALRGRAIPDIDLDLRDAQLQQMFADNSERPSARAAASLLADTTFLERNNPYGEGYAAQERFIAELRAVQRSMNGEAMTAVGRVLPPVPFEAIRKAADFEIVRERAPDVYTRLEAAQAAVRALEDQLENGPVSAKLKVTRDNPGGEWLERKRMEALKATTDALLSGETTGMAARGLVGSTTMTARVRLPVEQLRQLEGVLDERPAAGQVKFDRLTESVKEKGFKEEGAVMVWVNHAGQPYIYEGNNRIAVASLNNIPDLEVEIQWRNGAEEIEGPFSLEAIKSIVPLVPRSQEEVSRLRAEHRAATKEYQKAYNAVEAEGKRLHEQQTAAEVAQQKEASNILARVSTGSPFVGPLLRYDNVAALVDRINAFNDTLDEATAARFVREAEAEAAGRPVWMTEDGKVDIGLKEPVDPDFTIITDEGEMSVMDIMRDLQDDTDLVDAVRSCAI